MYYSVLSDGHNCTTFVRPRRPQRSSHVSGFEQASTFIVKTCTRTSQTEPLSSNVRGVQCKHILETMTFVLQAIPFVLQTSNLYCRPLYLYYRQAGCTPDRYICTTDQQVVLQTMTFVLHTMTFVLLTSKLYSRA